MVEPEEEFFGNISKEGLGWDKYLMALELGLDGPPRPEFTLWNDLKISLFWVPSDGGIFWIPGRDLSLFSDGVMQVD